MRKSFIILFVLLFSCSLMAQERTGNVYGKIVDEEGNSLPGVSVTLTGSLTAPISAITSVRGIFRFISLSPAKDYIIKAELDGFKTLTRENIVVSIGTNTELDFTMEMGVIEEEITVTAASPVVETKKTTITEHLTRTTLQSLPTSRDPWVVLQQASGVMVDRENVGGSESGQMAGFYAKGGGTEKWSMDGASIQDPSSISSITYFDFDSFEEMSITTGGGDVISQTGGVSINLVTRRGGNKVALGGRFYLTDKKFQAENLTDALKKEGVEGTNVIRNIKDYGFNMGGPLTKDKVWWWVSYGVQDIKTDNIYGAADDTILQNYAGKINLQIVPQNRFEAFIHVGGKEKFGRSSSYEFPKGYHQTSKFYFGTPIVKLQDEHMFGDNLFVSLKYSYCGGGFTMIATEDPDMEKLLRYDVTSGIYKDSYWFYNASRPSHNYYFLASYFNDSFLGASHELKFGFEFRNDTGEHQSRSPGNVMNYYNYNYPTVDIDEDNIPDEVLGIQFIEAERGWRDNNNVSGYAAYLSETLTVGRFNAILGFRYDHQTPKIVPFTMTAVEKDNKAWTDNFTPAAIAAIDQVLPGLEIPGVKPDYSWNFLSPRLGITYDLFGDGKTVAKLSLSRYGDYMGTGEAGYFAPLGQGGWMDFYWMDDGDGMADVTELYWTYPGDYSLHPVFDSSGNVITNVPDCEGWDYGGWGGYDYYNPQKTGAPRYTLDSNVGTPTVLESIFTLEREVLPNLSVALDFTYRRLDHYNWDLEWNPETGEKQNQGEYIKVGTIPATVGPHSTGDAAGKPYYLKKEDVPYRYYLYRESQPDFYRDFKGIDLRVTKRLSDKWMFNGSFSLQDQKVHYGDKGYLNPTNLWALDNSPYARYMGASSGKVSMNVFSRWLLKLSGLYQLPFDFNISFAFNAREGHIMPHTVEIIDYDAPNPRDQSIEVYLDEFGKERLPTFYNLNLRLEKVIRAGDVGRIYVMVDVFNLFNSAIMNRRYPRSHGKYYVHDESFAPNATDYMPNEVLNPRVIRFGVRFQF